jgi:cation transport regulator ChaC
VLRGYRLVFDVESRFWGGRVANLAEDRDGIVHGVLFEVLPIAKDAILRKEGVATGLSEEIAVTVEAGGEQLEAHAFVARAEKRSGPGAPSGRLMQYLLEGAQERGLPQAWVEELRKLAGGATPAQPPPGRVGLGRKP